MNKFLYAKLAADNLKKNRQNILPYLFSCIGTVMMFFIMISISLNSGLNSMYGAQYITSVISFGVGVIGLFSIVFLIYSNSFLMKRRKKEFGLFHILGMEKKHLALILFLESLYMGVLSLAAGIGLGILLYRLMFLLLVRLSGIQGTIEFQFSMSALRYTVLLIAVIYLINFLTGIWQIQKSQPVELLRGDQVGEKEPKAKVLTVFAGILTLGAGYYLAVTCESSLEALSVFFVAVVLVAVGTHCLFSAGSTAVLKALKRNRNYYYRLNHFTGVSGMIYRMKQNAAGLANICILSTGVLLVVSITACMWMGTESALKNRYPLQIGVNISEISDEEIDKTLGIIRKNLEEQGLTPVKVSDQRAVFGTVLHDGNRFYGPDSSENVSAVVLRSSHGIYLMTEEDFERWTGEKIDLEQGEAAVIPGDPGTDFEYDTIEIGDKTWKSKTMECREIQSESDVIKTTYVILEDWEEIQKAVQALGESQYIQKGWFYGMDFDLTPEEQITAGESLAAELKAQGAQCWVEIREKERASMDAIYGSVLFFGIFVGVLFLMATVMIIYYKQISEGYDDRKRYQIMQKVGMSREEVKQSIRSQILTVFFLPLLTAVIHTAVAFPFMLKLMNLMNFNNERAFLLATSVTILAFALVYALVYRLTARSYYRIVEEQSGNFSGLQNRGFSI